MRCYFLRDGHIGAVELVPDTSDAAAVERAHELFAERKDKGNFSGFEVWDQARFVHRYSQSAPKYQKGSAA